MSRGFHVSRIKIKVATELLDGFVPQIQSSVKIPFSRNLPCRPPGRFYPRPQGRGSTLYQGNRSPGDLSHRTRSLAADTIERGTHHTWGYPRPTAFPGHGNRRSRQSYMNLTPDRIISIALLLASPIVLVLNKPAPQVIHRRRQPLRRTSTVLSRTWRNSRRECQKKLDHISIPTKSVPRWRSCREAPARP
jgi:hypothetical protein